MKTISLKLEEGLDQRLTACARTRGTTKSHLVRNALRAFLDEEGETRPGSCLDLAGDVIGSVEGPVDLSVNPRHMRGFGV